jgi:glycerophosphoryl diester phosphodiesterase
MQPFLKIAHRGYSSQYPENTLVAFAKAIEAGADMIEFDVRLSKDGHLVVIHDESIDRTSDGTGMVADLTLQELKRYTYNNNMPRFGRIEIPTLAEVIDLAGDRILVNIELKNPPMRRAGMEKRLADLLEGKACKETLIVSSFDHYALAEMKRVAADVRTGMLYDALWVTFADEVRTLGVSSVHPGTDAVDPAQLLWAKDRGLSVYAWGVHDKGTLEQYRSSGFIDGVMVDDLDLF